jgi:hypothetical protein
VSEEKPWTKVGGHGDQHAAEECWNEPQHESKRLKQDEHRQESKQDVADVVLLVDRARERCEIRNQQAERRSQHCEGGGRSDEG